MGESPTEISYQFVGLRQCHKFGYMATQFVRLVWSFVHSNYWLISFGDTIPVQTVRLAEEGSKGRHSQMEKKSMKAFNRTKWPSNNSGALQFSFCYFSQ